MLSMGASWSIKKHVKGYMVLFLLLETGMMGVFLALDFFLFYVFWEVMLFSLSGFDVGRGLKLRTSDLSKGELRSLLCTVG